MNTKINNNDFHTQFMVTSCSCWESFEPVFLLLKKNIWLYRQFTEQSIYKRKISLYHLTVYLSLPQIIIHIYNAPYLVFTVKHEIFLMKDIVECCIVLNPRWSSEKHTHTQTHKRSQAHTHTQTSNTMNMIH